MTDQPKEKFFYTTYYPHRWSSGPEMRKYNNQYVDIASLEEAKALAEEKKVASLDDDRCITTYGSYFETEDESFKKL
jgi:hypothetical protein